VFGSLAAKRYNSMMNEKVKALSQEARKLAPAERAALIDELIASLDRPDASLDAVWAREAEDRLAAYDRGEMATHTIPEVVTKLRAQ
jgi:putative addiction module component (TIGR02574 family)